MKKILVISLVGWVMVLGLSPSELGETPQARVTIIRVAEPNQNPYQRLYEEMLYPTVRIETPQGVGSGVVIEFIASNESKESDRYILTAAHVVGNEARVKVEFFYPFSNEIEASVIITDTAKDLALLHTPSPLFLEGNKSLKSPLERGVPKGRGVLYSARLAPRDYTPWLFAPVYTIGCSLGLPPRPSAGIISVINLDYWGVSSPILPGNSGGPVYDAKTYEVIGIAVWVRTYHGQLVTTMAGIVSIQQIYEFLEPQITQIGPDR